MHRHDIAYTPMAVCGTRLRLCGRVTRCRVICMAPAYPAARAAARTSSPHSMASRQLHLLPGTGVDRSQQAPITFTRGWYRCRTKIAVRLPYRLAATPAGMV